MSFNGTSLLQFALVAYIVAGVVSLIGLIGIVYVAMHFLAKVW